MAEQPREPIIPLSKPPEKLKFNDLLIDNVNSWGNVTYNIPLRESYNETRTGTNIAHRFIPPIPHTYDCKINAPFPNRVSGRDMVVDQETYKTTSGEYCVKPNPNKATERADCAINCRRVIFMSNVEKVLQRKGITQPLMLSEMKDNYRGIQRPTMAPPEFITRAPIDEYTSDIVAAGRNEAPVISESSKGFRKQMDPYLSTYRNCHRPFTADEQYGIGAKDQITFYSDFNVPKVRGFGPRFDELWQPLTAKPYTPIYDKSFLKKEFKEVAASHNLVPNVPGVFESETKRKFKIPYAISALSTWSHGEEFNHPPYPPNPYQTNISPFMYCSDYCHIGQGTPPCVVIDQFTHHLPPHKHCVDRYKVSRD